MTEDLISKDPSNGEVVGYVSIADDHSIDQAFAVAKTTQKSWAGLSFDERVNILTRASVAMQGKMQGMSRLLSREMGKDIQRASGEVMGSISAIPSMAQEAAESLSPIPSYNGTIQYKPLGIAAIISPWNYPLAMANNLIIPALVAGNVVIFKPSEETPLIAEAYVKAFNEILPEGVLQILHGAGDIGQKIVEKGPDIVGFTGSMATGQKIMQTASQHLTRLVMELGGNDPMIVMEDADLFHAARFAVASSFENAGQMCTSTERIYVHESVRLDFEKMVVGLAKNYEIGPWDKPGVNIGPIINEKQRQGILNQIEDAKEKGARILWGGKDHPENYVTPTVVADITPDMALERYETFGPVVSIAGYTELDAVIDRANDSDYALGAVVFGGKQAAKVAERLEAGMIGVNSGPAGGGRAPWVGAKKSGFGFHGSPEGHRQFAQTRVVGR